MKKSFYISVVIVAFVAIIGFGYTVEANHSWESYHWARTSNPFNLKLGNNLSSAWKPYLATTSVAWSLSSVLDTTVVSGQGRSNCRATLGRVEVCSKTYGNNGWLGIAQIWISGTHIVQGTVKLNDTYFLTPTYNTTAWRNLVMCQEVGHTFGLNHQDENFDNPNLGTCMDYTNNPSTNQYPNQHDYDQLVTIYTHLDSSTTVGSVLSSKGDNKTEIDSDDSSTWGKSLRKDSKKRNSLFERDLGKGNKVVTFVIWAD